MRVTASGGRSKVKLDQSLLSSIILTHCHTHRVLVDPGVYLHWNWSSFPTIIAEEAPINGIFERFCGPLGVVL
jgi:hypothetical protein